MADNIPVAEFFARMGLDASDFINEVRAVRDQAKAEFEETFRLTKTFVEKEERALKGLQAPSGRNDAAIRSFELLTKAGANVDEIVRVMTNDFFRFDAGLTHTSSSISRLVSSLKTLGTSDIEIRFARMREEFAQVQKAFESGLISQRTFDQAKRNLDQLAQQVQKFQSGQGTGFPKADEAAIERAALKVQRAAQADIRAAQEAAFKKAEADRKYEADFQKLLAQEEAARKKAADKAIAEAQRVADGRKKSFQKETQDLYEELSKQTKAQQQAAIKARAAHEKSASRVTVGLFEDEFKQYETKRKLDAQEQARKAKAAAEEVKLERMMGTARREMDAEFAKRAVAKEKSIDKLSGSLRSGAQALQSFGTTMTYAVTFPLVGAAVSIIKVTSNLETMRASLARTAGSQRKADEIIVGLREFVNQAPLGIDNVAKMTRRIQELRISSRPATETLRTLGDAVFSLGGGEPELERVIKAFGDIAAAGKLAGQEVRQLVNANIPAIQLLATELGKTPAQIKDMMRKGALDADTTIEALMKGLNKRFAGEMANRMNTIAGEWTRLKNMLVFTLQDLGTSQLPLIKELLKTAQGFLKVVQDAARTFATLDISTQKFILGATAAVALIGPLSKMAGSWAGGWIDLIKGLKDVIKWVSGKGGIIGALSAIPGAAQIGIGAGIIAAVSIALGQLVRMNKEIDKTSYKLDQINNRYRGRSPAQELSRQERDAANERAREAQNDYYTTSASMPGGIPASLMGFKPKERDMEKEAEEAEKAANKFKQAMELLGLRDNSEDLRKFYAAWHLVMPSIKSDISKQLVENTGIKLLNDMLEDGQITLRQYAAELNKIAKLPIGGTAGRTILWTKELNEAKKSIDEVVKEYTLLTSAEQGAILVQQLINAEWIKGEQAALAFDKSVERMNQTIVTGRDEFGKLLIKISTPASMPAVAQLKASLDALGVKDRNADLATMREHLDVVTDAFQKGMISSRTYALSWEKYYKNRLENEGKLYDYETRHYEQIKKQLGVAARLQQYWKAVSTQISSIITDFSRSAIDILFPRGEEKTPFNQNITSGLESGYNKIAGAGYSNPRAALEQTLNSIRNATTLIEANRIAIRAFGDAGPQIAAGLRDGSISGEKLAGVLDKISSSLEEANDKGSKFKQLMGEIKVAILRAFAEEGAKAIADFVTKHLKRLISNLDEILAKIPIIGKGLEKIFGGKGGFDISQVPGVPTGGGAGPPQIPGVPIPGYPAPQTPPPTVPGGGVGSTASGLVGNINMISGIVSAGAGIATVWALIKLEGSINQVERNTAASAIHQRHILEKLNQYIPELSSIRGYLWDTFHPGFVELLSKTGGGGGGDTFNIYVNGETVTGADAEAVKMLTDGAKELRRRGYRGVKA